MSTPNPSEVKRSRYPTNVDGRSIPKPSYVTRFRKQEYSESRRRNWKRNFLMAYASKPLITHACEAADIPLGVYRKAIKEDEAFAEAFAEAKQAATDKAIEAVWEMGVEGEHEPIVWQGEIVAYRRTRDFKAAKFLLENMDPENWSPKERILKAATLQSEQLMARRGEMLQELNSKIAAFRPVLPSGEIVDAEVEEDQDEDD